MNGTDTSLVNIPYCDASEETDSLIQEHEIVESNNGKWILERAAGTIPTLLLLICCIVALVIMEGHASISLEDQNAIAQGAMKIVDSPNTEVIHLTTIHLRPDYVGRIEMVIKSILLFHGGIVHFHVMSDARSMETLSTMFQTWRIKRLRWSLYVLDKAHERIDFIPTKHRAGNMGFLRLFVHDILPLYVEKVILLDTDTMVLEDIATLHGFFKQMKLQGAFFGAAVDMYHRKGIRTKWPNKNGGTNAGVLLLDLKRMREVNWNDLWMKDTLWLLNKFGPLTSSEQDTFASLEVAHPNWGYRLPCEYNYQLGGRSDEIFCPVDRRYREVKLAHWTEGPKWSYDGRRSKYFTRIYQCVEMLDWDDINGVGTEDAMAPARTLLYMREGEIVHPDNITLSVATHFEDAFTLINRVGEWPGAVDVIITGSDRDRMKVRDFLSGQMNDIGKRVSVHFVHQRSNLNNSDFIRNVRKLGIDVARTDRTLLTFHIDALNISQSTYDALASKNNSGLTSILSNSSHEIGFMANMKIAQRLIAEQSAIDVAAKSLHISVSNFTSAAVSSVHADFKLKQEEYPPPEFCTMELIRRRPLINLTRY